MTDVTDWKRTAGIVTRSEAVFDDVAKVLQRIGMRRILHMAPDTLLATPTSVFWAVDGRWPGAGRLIHTLLAQGRYSGLAVASATDSAFIMACHEAGVPALVAHRTVEPPETRRAGPFSLSPKEIAVLTLCAEGLSNEEIGAKLGVTKLTVKSHLSRAARKMGTGDRAHMVMLALRANLI